MSWVEVRMSSTTMRTMSNALTFLEVDEAFVRGDRFNLISTQVSEKT